MIMMTSIGCIVIMGRPVRALAVTVTSLRMVGDLTSAFVPQLALIASICWLSLAYAQDADWPEYLGGKERNLYSPLEQINRSNVSRLGVAWTYETGDADEYQANNLIIDGRLYTPTQSRKVVALNAATGEQLWKWDPANENTGPGRARQRGVV